MKSKNIVIVYTTLYRNGGDKFKLVAETMAREKSSENTEVLCQAIESKADLKEIFNHTSQIDELHFVGHSGMYGPMFGTVKYPEQFSPYELQHLDIPFSTDGEAYFHCCRSARWFAPYFSRVQGVKTYGYHWYTSFSSRKDKYSLPTFSRSSDLYCFGCPGKKISWLDSYNQKTTRANET